MENTTRTSIYINEELWRKVKIDAIGRKMTLKAYLEHALRREVEKK